MGDVLPFKSKSLKEKHRGNTLCRNGHHKWRLENQKRFDVKRGKLVTCYTCTRCGKTRTEAL